MDITPILTYVSDNMTVLVAILLSLQALTLLLLLIVAIRSRSQGRRLASLLRTRSGESLEDMIAEFLAASAKGEKERAELLGKLEDLRRDLGTAVQRIGFVRYNAFPGVGGEMSFSIALLDGGMNGFILTSIFGREEARVYSKEIKQGQPSMVLSEEEIAAVRQAEQQGARQ